jgi:hypothetical protein
MTAASKKSRSIICDRRRSTSVSFAHFRILVQPFSAKGFGGLRSQKLEESGF